MEAVDSSAVIEVSQGEQDTDVCGIHDRSVTDSACTIPSQRPPTQVKRNTTPEKGVCRRHIWGPSAYDTVTKRLATFTPWSPANAHSPIDLAAAGFFYTGVSDQLQCYSCHVGLTRWQRYDDVWKEHARWSSQCAHVNNYKDEEFIKNALFKNPPRLEEYVDVDVGCCTRSCAGCRTCCTL